MRIPFLPVQGISLIKPHGSETGILAIADVDSAPSDKASCSR